MPNWCQNILSIQGEREELDRLVELTTKELDFDRIVPMPQHQEGIFLADGGVGKKEKEIYGKNNWYDWSVQNWGTKWNVDEVKFGDYGNTIEFTFETAWSPPLPIVDALMSRFPKLEFTLTYKELGMMFGGEYGTFGDIEFSEDQLMIEDIQDWTDMYFDFIDDEPEHYTSEGWMDLYNKAGNKELIEHAEKAKKAVKV